MARCRGVKKFIIIKPGKKKKKIYYCRGFIIVLFSKFQRKFQEGYMLSIFKEGATAPPQLLAARPNDPHRAIQANRPMRRQ